MGLKLLKWYKLDNAAKVYPILISDRYTHVFRVSVTLNETVNPEILEKAIFESKKRFPSFFVRLKRGFFWYYFEENPRSPILRKESPLVCEKIHEYTNNRYLFAFLYYENRISLEVNHVITDGVGAIKFLNSILLRYLELSGHEVDGEDKVINMKSRLRTEELEDGFERFHDNTEASTPKIPDAYIYRRKTFKHFGSGVINSFMDTKSLRTLAKSNEASLTQYIVSLLIYSLIANGDVKKMRKNPINICVPVNLRGIFPSESLYNFSLVFHTSYQMKDPNPDFQDILEKVKSDFDKGRTIDNYQTRLNLINSIQKKWWVKLIPLPLKYIIFKIGYRVFGRKPTTVTFSNLGSMDVPESMSKHIDSYLFFMSSGYKHAIAMNSFNDKVSIVFSRAIIDTDLEKTFFRFLTEKGIEVEITSNYWEYFGSRRKIAKQSRK